MDAVRSDVEIAIPTSVAARIAGISERRLKAWDQAKLLQPAIRRQLSERNTIRLYGFQELVELRVLRALHERQMSPRHIATVIGRLRSRGYDAPLRQLVYAVAGKELFFQHPNGEWEGGRRPDQIVLHEVLDLELIRSQVRRALGHQREEDALGKVERRRKVLGSKPVFAGTRTPVSAVMNYLEKGYTNDEILEALPHLTVADVNALRARTS